jgi:hypothetical protein
MGLIAEFPRPAVDDAVGLDEDDAPDWSPRARTLTVIAAALASWAVVGAIVYLVGAAASIWS